MSRCVSLRLLNEVEGNIKKGEQSKTSFNQEDEERGKLFFYLALLDKMQKMSMIQFFSEKKTVKKLHIADLGHTASQKKIITCKDGF